MSRKSNSELLAQYRQRVSTSTKWVQEDYHGQWRRLINLYRGKHYTAAKPYDRMLVNIAFATINTLYPSVSIGRPKIVVNPRGPEDADKAVIAEAIVNYWWEHYQCQEEFQLAVRDFLIIGHGWVKSGYRYVEEDRFIEESADELADGNPTNYAEATTIVLEDRPFIERVDPMNMFVDPEGTSMKDIRWIAQRVRRTVKDVKNDKRYDYSARQEVTATSLPKWSDINAAKDMLDKGDESFCDIYEFYDIDKKTMCVFSDSGGDKFLVKPTEIPFSFGHPFTMLRNYDIPGYFYPMGELEAIEPLQYELNETRTQMMNHRKRYSRKYLFKENAFDDFGRNALASDEDNAMVPVKGDENLANVVAPMPALINPPDFYNQSSLIIGDIDRVSGLSDYQRGVLPEVRRTATEASILQGVADSRAAEKLTLIEKGVAKVAYRLIKLAQQYMTEEQVVRVVDKRGAWSWVEFDRDYIDGEFDFTVEAGSTVPQNEGFRRQRALQLVDAMAPFAQAGVVKLEALAKIVLEQGFGIKDADNYLNIPEPVQPQQPSPVPQEPPMPAEIVPPEMSGLPAGMPQGVAPMPQEMAQMPQGASLPPELAQIPGVEQVPPELVLSMPPDLIQSIISKGGFTPEVLAILQQNNLV